MKRWVIAFIIILVVSIFIGLLSNLWGGIITFFALGIFAFIFLWQIQTNKTKPLARKLLTQDAPDKTELEDCINVLNTSDDEESRDLVRKLIAKRGNP